MFTQETNYYLNTNPHFHFHSQALSKNHVLIIKSKEWCVFPIHVSDSEGATFSFSAHKPANRMSFIEKVTISSQQCRY